MRSFWGSLVVVIVVAVAGRAQKRTLRFSYCYHDHHCDHHCDHDHHYIIITTMLVVAVLDRILVDRRSIDTAKQLECIWWPFSFDSRHLCGLFLLPRVFGSREKLLSVSGKICEFVYDLCNRPTFCHKLSSADCADLFLFVFSPLLLLLLLL